MAQQHYPTLDQLVREVNELRPLPTVAARILEVTESDKFSAHVLVSVIASDQALSAKLLRLANSAYYGYSRRISTVRDAVVLLGFRAVRASTLASCVIEAVPGSRNINYERFWQHSVSIGMLAEILARAEGAHHDHAFTAGVLHNIGRLALDQRAPDALADALLLAAHREIELHAAERQLLGYTDAQLGGALALHWNFPRPLVEAVSQHAAPLTAPPAAGSLAACVVRARHLARAYGIADGVEAAEPRDLPAEWTHPPLSIALNQAGGMEGVIERAEAFLEATLSPAAAA